MRREAGFLVLALASAPAACASGPRHPPAYAEEVAVIDATTTARGIADGVVELTALATSDGHTRAGSVRLRAPSMREAARSPHVVLARARAWQVLALDLAGDPVAAFAAARRGVELLRDCCRHTDASLYAHRADHLLAQGDPASALATIHAVLGDLIARYAQHHRALFP